MTRLEILKRCRGRVDRKDLLRLDRFLAKSKLRSEIECLEDLRFELKQRLIGVLGRDVSHVEGPVSICLHVDGFSRGEDIPARSPEFLEGVMYASILDLGRLEREIEEIQESLDALEGDGRETGQAPMVQYRQEER